MKCLNPSRITKNLDREKFPDGLLVPCGKCMYCRIQARENWTLRILHEINYWKESMFLTLTYDEENVPKDGSLLKSDLQKFFKRLRKNLDNNYDKRKIAYFACGEYGEERGRPHYHVLLFGLDHRNDEHKQLIKDSWNKCDWVKLSFNPKKKPFGDISRNSIRYVVGYMEKSIKGNWKKYAYNKIEEPFHLLSKGIGKRYAIENRELLQEEGFCPVGKGKKKIPRYYSEVADISREKMQELAREKDVDFVYAVTGMQISSDDLYHLGDIEDNRRLNERRLSDRVQNDRNLKSFDDKRKRRRF